MRLEQVVFVPAAPLLIPDLASGAANELGDVRKAISEHLNELDGSRVLVVGGATETSAYSAESSMSLRGFGVPDFDLSSEVTLGEELPAALSVGAWLCRDSSIRPVGFVGVSSFVGSEGVDAATELVRAVDPTALVIVGDGSARRSPAAPGALDERAAGFDATVERCLAEVDVHALLEIDPALCAELLVGGRAAWQVAARAIGEPSDWHGRAEMFDPYGVAYFVGAWARVDG